MSLAAAANAAFLLGNLPSAGCFRRALREPAKTQLAILTGYLRRNAATEYGRLHAFDRITSAEKFQRRVPVSDYETYRPFIEKIAAGKPNILTYEPVRRFALTSGSAGAEKWIPYTRSLTAEFRRGISPWLANLYTTMPDLRRGPAYWSITPVTTREHRTSSVPVGFDEDSAYLGGIFQRIAQATFAVPSELRHLQNIDTFRYLTLLCLLRARDLRLISVWHPSFLTLLLDAAEEFWEPLLNDIRRGTFSPPSTLPAEMHRAFRRWCKPAPAPTRAAELHRLGPRAISQFWPSLGVISCWTDAAARVPAQKLAALFPNTMLQPKGLLSTEAFISLPLINGTTSHHPLAIRSHFFEFLPDTGNPILAHAAEPGGIYTVLITTAGGFYRYNTHDRVRITGRCHQTPCLEFLGKSDLVSDLCGEKLNALFVADLLASLQTRLNLKPSFLMLAPDSSGYTLFIEISRELPQTLPAHLDAALSKNPHYAYCRHLGQLAPARIFQIDAGAAVIYLETCRQMGQRLGDIKPTPLHRDTNWSSRFPGHYLVRNATPASSCSPSAAPPGILQRLPKGPKAESPA